MIDLHSHLLPGIDDGAPDMETAIAMGRAAVAGGVDTIVATPHVNRHYPNDPLEFAARRAHLQSALDRAGVALRVQSGAEVAHSRLSDLSDETLSACGLGGSNWLLFELPLRGPAPFAEAMTVDLQRRGFRIVLAHPERIAAFQREPDTLGRLVEQGCLCSVTAGSVYGQFGESVKRFTADLFAGGLVHNLATDAHDAQRRSPALQPQLSCAAEELPELAGWFDYLVDEVPAAILAGDALPGAPPVIEPRRGIIDRLRGR
jgi:protein-tyrosine phosphatase